MSSYPCGDCRRNCKNTYCYAYKKWFEGAWQGFHRYGKSLYRKGLSGEKFYYEHPERIRRYLREGVCAHCPANKVCDTPCPIYWRWWDARMEFTKKLAESTERR